MCTASLHLCYTHASSQDTNAAANERWSSSKRKRRKGTALTETDTQLVRNQRLVKLRQIRTAQPDTKDHLLNHLKPSSSHLDPLETFFYPAKVEQGSYPSHLLPRLALHGRVSL